MKTKGAAVVTIKDAKGMTPKGRREVAAWLRECADGLLRDGKMYAPRFTARYLYR